MILETIMRKCFFSYQTFLSKYIYDCRSDSKSRVYMFHSISNNETNSHQFNCNKNDFYRFLSMINMKALPITEIADYPEGYYAISFDDVYEDVYKYAVPFLEKAEIPYTLFMTTDYINKEGYLSLDMLKELSQSKLCNIGAHTVSHPILRYEMDSKYEIQESKKKIEELLGIEINLFAYPYGSIYACSHKNRREVKRSGYKYAFSSVAGTINNIAKKDLLFLPRISGDRAVEEMINNE